MHDSNSNDQPATAAPATTWAAPLHPLGATSDAHPTPLGHAAAHMLHALGLNPSATHLVAIRPVDTRACHQYFPASGTPLQRLANLQQDQDNGWNAYYRANGGPNDTDVTHSNVVQVDFDDLPTAQHAAKLQALVDAGLPAPTLALDTGSGTSLHVYWRLQHPLPEHDNEQQVRRLQQAICNRFGGDLCCVNPSRMMRLAGGTYHAKTTGAPIGTAHVTWHDAANPHGHPFDTLWQWALASATPQQRGEVELPAYDADAARRLAITYGNPLGATKGSKYTEATRVADSLDRLDPDDYNDWLRVGFALHEAGYPVEVWDNWSRGSAKYVPDACAQKWRGFGKGQGKRVGLGTLVAMAKEADPSYLRPGAGTPTQQQLRQQAENAIRAAATPTPAPPAPAAGAGASDTPPATLAEALLAQAQALRNNYATADDPSWAQVVEAVGLLQAQGQITALQAAAIKECAVACGITRRTFDADTKAHRDAAARDLSQERRQQHQQHLQNRAMAAATPPGVQVLGLTPDGDLVLRTAQGNVTAISPGVWRREWLKWAPLAWMLGHYPTGGDNPKPDPETCYADWHANAATMPPCPTDSIRGPGIHLEPVTGAIVWNTGRTLVISPPGGPTYQAAHADYAGQLQYIATGRSTLQPGATPLPDAQGLHLLQLHQAMAWQGANDGLLAYGWVVAAPVGGALPYRPQLAYTGESGGGKTWASDHVMVPLMGGTAACHVAASATPAGLRSLLDGTGLPAMVDETENSTTAGTPAWEEILRLAYGGGTRPMGQAGGGSKLQHFCTALCTLGINQGTDNTANANRRITVCRAYMGHDAWAALELQLLAACTVANGQALVLRTFNNLRNTLANVPHMLQALRPTYRDKGRDLRNVALLLAFAHSATSTATLDATSALAWLQQVGWDFASGSNAGDDATHMPEGLRLLQELLAVPATLQLQELADDNPIATHTTVAGLVAMAQDGGAMALGPAAANGMRARAYLWARYGLGICQGDHAGYLLWATGPKNSKARQVAMRRSDVLQQWARGSDAKRHLEGLPGVVAVRLRPLPTAVATYGNSSMPPASGLAIPLALLEEAADAAETQVPSDAPCDNPPPPPVW